MLAKRRPRGYQAAEPRFRGLCSRGVAPTGTFRLGSGFVHPVQTPFWGGR